MRKVSNGLLLVAGFLLIGCGAQSHLVRKSPSQPLSMFKIVEMKPVTISKDLIQELDPSKAAILQGLAATVAPKVDIKLSTLGYKNSSTDQDRLVIESEVVSYDPGSQALRYFIGLGAGSSKTVTTLQFKNTSGDVIAVADFTCGVSAGMFGGNESSAVDRLVNEIVDYITKERSSRS